MTFAFLAIIFLQVVIYFEIRNEFRDVNKKLDDLANK